MKASSLLLTLSIAVCLGQEKSYPMWKVFCSGRPLYRGRLDSIVTPGEPAGHVHKVVGGNHFSAGVRGQSNLELYEVTKSADCTTCSIHTVDNSNYWHPELYYQWPNGTFSLVPDGGLTVYYIARSGNVGGPQYVNPNWQPFPKGLRMIAGDPWRRTYDKSNVEHNAISFVCLTDFGMPHAPETNGFQTDKYFCKNGFRMQVFFPMCWDGKNLDSPDHRSHMAYSSQYNTGDCPATHPVRLPALFYEAFYSVDKFPHGTGRQPFVLSSGDPTGYGFHGDFVNGWDFDVVKNMLADSSCLASNTNLGNNPERCLPLKPFVKQSVDANCELAKPIPLTENIGMIEPIKRLPGCNPITYSNAAMCSQGSDPRSMDNTGTFHIKSKVTGRYVTFNPITEDVYANAPTNNPSYRETWGLGWAARDTGRTVRNTELNRHFTMQDKLKVRGPESDTWEIFSFEKQSDSDYIAIKNRRHGKYLQVEPDFSISGTATIITDACLFQLITPDGGHVPVGLQMSDLANLQSLSNNLG
ncbi:unnamed protein product [Didymodactylos carnosus]|uniref:DUF1996 domain-containing protein n=2 Tax=Didymodactylos carnosus TaxID=1234261 RepID=A0A814GJU2_9BILA|nr:unnamed protein product [Didymodactylos carnosus]CAF3768992.1 unnamed protein product [Didymodactylos carnosus]